MQGRGGEGQTAEDERKGDSGESHKPGTEQNPKDSAAGVRQF